MFEVRDEHRKTDPRERRDDLAELDEATREDERSGEASQGMDEATLARHRTLMDLMRYEGDRQAEERQQMQIDEDYQDHLQWRPEDAMVLMERGQAPLVYNQGRLTLDWVGGMEKRMRKDYKVLPRERDDEQAAEIKTKLIKYTDDVNDTVHHRSKAFKQAAVAGLSWLEEGLNPDPERELIYSGTEDWRNVLRDSHSRNLDYNVDARYLFRRKVVDADWALALLPHAAEVIRAEATDYGQHGDVDDEWYVGERLTSAAQTEWGTSLNSNMPFMQRSGMYEHSAPRTSVELIECWYKVPERVKVFTEGEFAGQIAQATNPLHAEMLASAQEAQRAIYYEAVKMRMRVMICTRNAPLLDMASPFKHQRFLLVPVWAYRRARDGMAYGIWRAMRDIQDDLNKRQSKALWSLSNNQIIVENGAVEDIEELRQEASRPDGILLVKNAGKRLEFRENLNDMSANLNMAQRDIQMMRDVGGVTNENLGQDTNATSGRAIGMKQDQGQLTTAELFDNLLLSIKHAGRLRLSHIEQFYSGPKVLRIVGEAQPIEWLEVNQIDPATGRVLNDITAREADFIVDTQDYRASLAQAAMEQVFDLLGKIATFAPQMVLSLLDLVVETVDVRGKDEWVARIRKLNGQRDPTKPLTPEEEQAQLQAAQAQQKQQQIADLTAEAALAKLQAEVAKIQADASRLSADEKLKFAQGVKANMETLFSAMQAGQVVVLNPTVAPVADELAASTGFQDMNGQPTPMPQPSPVDAAGLPADPALARGPSAATGAQRGIHTVTPADNQPPMI
ncbi:hypothetical protein CCO03_17010 [Comamonas serinivorans]|uniref:Portal protein n=1 Tax=Comamonas serinivorans TaxID=1082851 RepID=A0A1Y0ERE3_9BURK|nr:portal protein [Comamonas serinivorans]ARU06146.1 hypothetical protein CCO03_17010 [Comamonas serinivorans]